MRVVRPRRGFRVILHAEERQRAVTQPFQGVVVQIDMGLDDLRFLERVWVYGEVMVVRGDLDLARLQLLYRMVAAVMAKLQLVRPPAQRQPDHLMAKADSENRRLA